MSSTTSVYNIAFILRKKLWMMALIFLAFLFALPIRTGVDLQYLSEMLHAEGITKMAFDSVLNTAENNLQNIFSINNMFLTIVLLVVALVAGLGFFNWMHKKSRVDLHFSLPVSRHILFRNNFIAGSLTVVIPLLINIIFSLIVIVAMGFGSCIPWAALFSGFGLHVLFFLLCFSLVVIAVCISGNSVVSGILSMVFLGVGPVCLALYHSLRQLFQPYWYSGLIDWGAVYAYSSPLARYVYASSSELNQVGLLEVFLLLLLAAGLYVAGSFIFRHRPAEAAGRALAFPKTRVFIKYPLVIIAAAGGAFLFNFFADMSDKWIWFFFGAVLIGFIAAQLMEIVYHADFHAIRRRLVPLAIVLAAFCGASGLFITDVFGYNSYLPEKEDVAAVEIHLDGVNSYMGAVYTNYDIPINEYSYMIDVDSAVVYNQQTTGGALFDLINTSENRLRRGRIESEEGISAAIDIIDKILQFADSYYTDEQHQLYYYNYPNTTTAIIRYTLTNGKTVCRSYQAASGIEIEKLKDELALIYADETYRDNIYTLFAFAPEQVRVETVYSYEQYLSQQYSYSADSNASGFLNVDCSALLAAFEKETKAITAEEMMENMPIGEINFRIYASDPGVIGLPQQHPRKYYAITYPIYASFSETLALLQEMGLPAEIWQIDYQRVAEIMAYENAGATAYRYDVDPAYAETEQGLLAEAIKETGVMTTDSYFANEKMNRYTDIETITELMDNSYDENCFRMNSFIQASYTKMYQVSYNNGLGGLDYATRYPIE